MFEDVRVVLPDGSEIYPVQKSIAEKLIKKNLVYKINHIEDSYFVKEHTLEEVLKIIEPVTQNEEVCPCWGCGEFITTKTNKRAWCEKCFTEKEEKREKDLEMYSALKVKMIFERAMQCLENQDFPLNMVNYKESAEAVCEYATKNKKAFESSFEMVTAIELIRNQVRVKLQQTIAGHRVDMLLPKLKIALEVDGYMHDRQKMKDKEIDIRVRKELGPEWEIVRVPTKYLSQNIQQLLPAVKAMKEEMVKARKLNSGILPEMFSSRDKALWKSAKKGLKAISNK